MERCRLQTAGWAESGIEKGDTVLIHSSLQRTIRRYGTQGMDISPEMVLDSFLEAVGPSGTILLPLFNFDFAKGIPFDIRRTPSRMGALTEAGRVHPGAVRTGHPIYSFAAIGAKAERFRGVDNFSGYGEDSPFALLRELDGKIAVLDLADQDSVTFYHHVEEMHKVPYRYHKTFSGNYRDQCGKTAVRSYGLFVRDLEQGVLTHVNPAGELLWERGLYKGCRPREGSGLRVISARKMFDFVSSIILSGRAKGLLYAIEGEAHHG
jgi:aminoglycoside 3-N-acetyltransferase